MSYEYVEKQISLKRNPTPERERAFNRNVNTAKRKQIGQTKIVDSERQTDTCRTCVVVCHNPIIIIRTHLDRWFGGWFSDLTKAVASGIRQTRQHCRQQRIFNALWKFGSDGTEQRRLCETPSVGSGQHTTDAQPSILACHVPDYFSHQVRVACSTEHNGAEHIVCYTQCAACTTVEMSHIPGGYHFGQRDERTTAKHTGQKITHTTALDLLAVVLWIIVKCDGLNHHKSEQTYYTYCMCTTSAFFVCVFCVA